MTFCENELTLLGDNRKTSSPSDSALHLLSHLLQPHTDTQSRRHTHTQTHTQWRYVLGVLSEQHWILSLLCVSYSSGTYPEPRTVFLTHSSFYDHSWQCTPQVIGGPTNFIAIDIQTQQLLYSAKNLACFPSGLRWTGSTSSERMTEPNGVSPQDGRGMQRCKPCWLDVTV